MQKQIKRKSAWIIGGLLASYLTGCLLLRWGQTRLMFFPDSILKATPDTVGLAYEDIWLPMPQGSVHGWWIPAADRAPVVLYLHGNGSNLGDLVTRAKRLHQLGLTVLLIDYRGYGRSPGLFPSEASVYADAEAAWQYLTQTRQIAPDTIVLYGQSIGGAVAIELASRHPEAAAVIAESTFTSMRAMVAQTIPEYLLPIDWLLTQQFDSLSKVRSLQVPILLIHGTADDTIPATMSQDLFAAAPNPKHLLLIPDANHDNVARLGGNQFLQTIKQFIERAIYQPPSTVQDQATAIDPLNIPL
jgi:pimeloyl-ACP methyl ester carboxylesterase